MNSSSVDTGSQTPFSSWDPTTSSPGSATSSTLFTTPGTTPGTLRFICTKHQEVLTEGWTKTCHSCKLEALITRLLAMITFDTDDTEAVDQAREIIRKTPLRVRLEEAAAGL